MKTQDSPLQHLHFVWKIIILINFVFGLLLWIFFVTDYHFKGDGVAVNALIFITGLGGLLSWLYLRQKSFAQKSFYIFACEVSTFAGLPLIPLLFLTVFGGAFNTIQQIEIRNGQSVINNEYVCSGKSYCVIEVNLQYDFLPFFQRDIYRKRSQTPAHVSWINNETIAISLSGEQLSISPGWIKFEWPGWNMSFVFLYFVYLLTRRIFIKQK